MTVDRENMMIKLKKEINELKKRLGEKEPYDISFFPDDGKNDNN